MAASRNIIVAGAGIGGLTAALALVQRGFRVTLIDQAQRLETAGAGIQLSPNATRVLIGLGLEQRLRTAAVAPWAVDVRTSRGKDLARIPLGNDAGAIYGAPYWTFHRGDLQAVLYEAAAAHPDIEIRLGLRAEDFATHSHGVSVACRRGTAAEDQYGIALIGADGLWSALRRRLGNNEQPQFRGRAAWRALVTPERLEDEFGRPNVHLWLGRDAHLVHYPVSCGRLVNIVAIVADGWTGESWSQPGARDELLKHFPSRRWSPRARAVLEAPDSWMKWALADLGPLRRWGDGPVTLLGDAAHPALPFLAQGAAMAIEDAAVLAASLARTPDDVAGAMRRYETSRRARTRRVQRTARLNGRLYHLKRTAAAARNAAMRTLGGYRILRSYDWLYSWRPLPPPG